ncbi:hypothetical protein OQA88_7152 [Cercophora sp. LCS_1]
MAQPLKLPADSTARTKSPAPIDTSGLTKDLTASVSPTTSHSAEAAKRAMSTTETWKPCLNRRQSWDAQEYRHEMQRPMQTSADGGRRGSSGGFTEQG